jgi:hypothetical protein
MVKVFRNFRRGIFTEGKFSNYLVYAVGEIILVVIGILIALAINNSNQNRQRLEKEQIYLAGLKDEFYASKLKLGELIRINRQSYEGARSILEYISDTSAPPRKEEFSELLYNTFAFDLAFNPNNSLLNEMISSGSLKDLTNPDLRIHLTNWISTLDDIAKQEIELGLQREKVLDMMRGKEYSLRTILEQTGVLHEILGLENTMRSPSNMKLLESREFENNVLMFILASYATETAHYQPLMQELDQILTLIDAELDN